jgi:hypothetical protein
MRFTTSLTLGLIARTQSLLKRRNWIAEAYARGVQMGGDLPALVVWALKDPNSGNLDRLQMIKVWEEDGQQLEKVFDMAWAGARKPDPATGLSGTRRRPHELENERRSGELTARSIAGEDLTVLHACEHEAGLPRTHSKRSHYCVGARFGGILQRRESPLEPKD